MSTLIESIRLKSTPLPVVFSGTSVVLQPSHFPYPYHWRGNYQSPVPIIYNRQAGYRKIIEPVRYAKYQQGFKLPTMCFEAAPSTRFPCYNIQNDC